MSIDVTWTKEPWLPYLATQYIKKHLRRESVFEWGSGGSTIFFNELGTPFLISVEHDQEWYSLVKEELEKLKTPYQAHYHLIPYEQGEIGPDKGNPAHYKSGSTELGEVNFRQYASFIDQFGKFDLVLIDGMARASCLAHAVNHVKEGGCIILDNTGDRPYYLAQTSRLFQDWERITFFGYGPILEYAWETTIFRNTRKDSYG